MARSIYNVSGIVLSTLAVDESMTNLFSGTNNGDVHKVWQWYIVIFDGGKGTITDYVIHNLVTNL